MSLDYEQVATLAQKYIENRPVVVLGCGASIPYGLPSMSDLAQALLTHIDINDSGWEKFKESLQETNDLEKSLHEIELSDDLLELIVGETWKITAEKDIEIYNCLIKGSIELDLSRLFRFLLRTANPQISVITTNYDRLAEYAANMAKAEVFTGFTSGWIKRFVAGGFPTAKTHRNAGFEGEVHVLKVHGSLDWFTNPSDEPLAVPLARAIPSDSRPLIVTPGISKYREVHKDPFRTVMTQSDQILRNANSYLCIGFGFNDEHVQPILVNRVRRDNLPIIIVTKELTPAARQSFLDQTPSKFLIIEEHEEGTTVYCPENPSGQRLNGCELWKLSQFLNLLLGEKEK